MSSIWGDNIKLSIFGESHGKAIGVNIDGLPPGLTLDLQEIRFEMNRRAPGKDKISTSRSEKDEFEILSGYFNNKTTGSPLCAIIRNTNTRPRDYEKTKNLIRPGHADYTGYKKYLSYNDYRGGGHFSGRLTATICFAGAIARQIIKFRGILIGGHIKSIGNIEEKSFDDMDVNEEVLKKLRKTNLPTIEKEKAKEMEKLILDTKKENDSIGGVVEIIALNVEPGLGSPFFDSIESKISQMVFSIPGVKGIEFGKGFEISKLKGSEANDEFYIEKGNIKTYTNNNGGILGGISNGMPIIFKVALKPTPSIGKVQKTVDIETRENKEIEISGRHDPSIVIRALPVIEGATALVILDLLMEMEKWEI